MKTKPYCPFLFQISVVNTTYIMSSSYPKYYLSGEQCHWRLIIAPHQSLLVTLLDLQLRGVVTGQCRDGLTLDNKITLCGELRSELHYVTGSNNANILFHIDQDHQECH